MSFPPRRMNRKAPAGKLCKFMGDEGALTQTAQEIHSLP
jgi:hypothetical protein